MVGSRRVKGAVSAPTEGARRATGVGADGAAVGSGALAPGQRWSASRKRDVVLRSKSGQGARRRRESSERGSYGFALEGQFQPRAC